MLPLKDTVSDAAGLASAYTAMPEDEALALVARHYDRTGKLKRFATEKDDTFRLTTNDGEMFVLKIANPGESFGEIDFQHSILKQIAQADSTLPVPRVIGNTRNEDLFQITASTGQKRFVRMLTFLPGTPLCETSSNAAERHEIGKVLARLRHATAGVSHPSENRILAWDVQHLLTLQHLLSDVGDASKRAKLAAGLDRFSLIEPRLRNCRKQVLHNDFSRSNIVVDHDNPKFVNGIIDFGDSARTAIAIDVATALLNQLPEEPAEDMFEAGRDLLRGYLAIAELTEEEFRLVPHLVMARVVARALITLWRAKKFPENQTYILRNTEQGWHQLDWFLARSIDEISDNFVHPFREDIS